MSKKKKECIVHFQTVHYDNEFNVFSEVIDYDSLDILLLFSRMDALFGTEITKHDGKCFRTFKIDNLRAYVHLPNGKYFVLFPDNYSE